MRLRSTIALMFLLGPACDREPAPAPAPAATVAQAPAAASLTPAEVVTKYYDAMAAGRLDEAYGYVTYADRSARPLEEFVASATNPVQAALLKRRSYEITNTIIDGEMARVDVTVTDPDVARLQRLIVAELQSTGAQLSAEVLNGKMIEALAKPDVPTIVSHHNVLLTLEPSGGGWGLDFDWDKEHPLRGVPVQERPKKAAPDAGG